MPVVNLTGHRIDILREDGTIATVWPAPEVVRAELDFGLVDVVEGIGVFVQLTTCDTTLPPPVEGTVYVVSAYTKMHFLNEDRPDVLCPGQVRRDAAGRVIACRGLQQMIGEE
jgi:hypothetical protein